MDFIFMLTRNDKTVPDCLEVFDNIQSVGIQHVGFKDIGVDSETLAELAEKIKSKDAIAYLEVVSTTSEDARRSIDVAAEIGVDRVLGGQDTAHALNVLKPLGIEYYPFPGRPHGHPTVLEGTPSDILEDCQRALEAGCSGVDLLAYRTVNADPLDLIRAARNGVNDGYLVVAGSIDSPERIRAVGDAGADAFTIGTAAFNNEFDLRGDTLKYQCEAILKAASA